MEQLLHLIGMCPDHFNHINIMDMVFIGAIPLSVYWIYITNFWRY